MTDSPSQNSPSKVSTLFRPSKRPAVTIAGRIGIKISPSILINRCRGFIFWAAAALTSSLGAAAFPCFFFKNFECFVDRALSDDNLELVVCREGSFDQNRWSQFFLIHSRLIISARTQACYTVRGCIDVVLAANCIDNLLLHRDLPPFFSTLPHLCYIAFNITYLYEHVKALQKWVKCYLKTFSTHVHYIIERKKPLK